MADDGQIYNVQLSAIEGLDNYTLTVCTGVF